MATSYSEGAHADAPGKSGILQDGTVAALLLLGGAVNGLAVKVVEGLDAGVLSLTLGLSPFQLAALAVAMRLVLAGQGTARALPIWADVLALMLILVPSSTVSWAAVGLYGAATAQRWSGEKRTGALLFVALAASALWSSVLLKWLAGPVTTAEAWIIGHVAGLLRPDIIQSGNVIGNPEIHSLVLMTACTTTDALPTAALALIATGLMLGRIDTGRIFWALAILGVLYFSGNVARLVAMSWSGELYAFWHGAVGRNIFDVAQIAVVLGLGNWVSRP